MWSILIESGFLHTYEDSQVTKFDVQYSSPSSLFFLILVFLNILGLPLLVVMMLLRIGIAWSKIKQTALASGTGVSHPPAWSCPSWACTFTSRRSGTEEHILIFLEEHLLDQVHDLPGLWLLLHCIRPEMTWAIRNKHWGNPIMYTNPAVAKT